MDSVLCHGFNRCDELAIFFIASVASVPANHLRYKSASLHASVPFGPICAGLTGLYLISAPFRSPLQSTMLARRRRAARLARVRLSASIYRTQPRWSDVSAGRRADGPRSDDITSTVPRDGRFLPSIADRCGAGRRWVRLGANAC